MATLATETWTGTNGAAWPTQWTTGGSTGAAASIQSNRGRLTPGAGSYATARADLNSEGMSAVSDTDATVTFFPSAVGASEEGWFFLRVRGDGVVGTQPWWPRTGYQLWVYKTTSNNVQAYVRRYSSNAETTLGATYQIPGPWPTSGMKARLQAIGGTIQFKLWNAADPEPGTWAVTATDGTPLPAGRVGVLTVKGSDTVNVRPMDFDDLTVTDGDPTAPGVTGGGALTAGAGALSGTGALRVTGAAAAAAAVAGAAGTGIVSLSGGGALGGLPPAVSGSGTATVSGNGSTAAPPATVSAVGSVAAAGAGVLAAEVAALTGAGSLTAAGDGAMAVNPANLTGGGTLTVVGAGQVAAQAAQLAANALLVLAGSGALTAAGGELGGAGAVLTAPASPDLRPGTVTIAAHLSAALLAPGDAAVAVLAVPAYATATTVTVLAVAALTGTGVSAAVLDGDGVSAAALAPHAGTATLHTT